MKMSRRNLGHFGIARVGTISSGGSGGGGSQSGGSVGNGTTPFTVGGVLAQRAANIAAVKTAAINAAFAPPPSSGIPTSAPGSVSIGPSSPLAQLKQLIRDAINQLSFGSGTLAADVNNNWTSAPVGAAQYLAGNTPSGWIGGTQLGMSQMGGYVNAAWSAVSSLPDTLFQSGTPSQLRAASSSFDNAASAAGQAMSVQNGGQLNGAMNAPMPPAFSSTGIALSAAYNDMAQAQTLANQLSALAVQTAIAFTQQAAAQAQAAASGAGAMAAGGSAAASMVAPSTVSMPGRISVGPMIPSYLLPAGTIVAPSTTNTLPVVQQTAPPPPPSSRLTCPPGFIGDGNGNCVPQAGSGAGGQVPLLTNTYPATDGSSPGTSYDNGTSYVPGQDLSSLVAMSQSGGPMPSTPSAGSADDATSMGIPTNQTQPADMSALMSSAGAPATLSPSNIGPSASDNLPPPPKAQSSSWVPLAAGAGAAGFFMGGPIGAAVGAVGGAILAMMGKKAPAMAPAATTPDIAPLPGIPGVSAMTYSQNNPPPGFPMSTAYSTGTFGAMRRRSRRRY